MRHQNLPITANSSSDTDGRDFQPLGDKTRQPRRNGLEHNAEAARFLKQQGIFQQQPGRTRLAPLRTKTTELIHTLWG
jgi:hypothetical protein